MAITVRRLAIGIVALALAGVACDSGGGGGSVEAFCGLEQELGDVEIPTNDQLNSAVDAAPSEIKGDVRTLADALKDAGEDQDKQLEAFSDPDVQEASANVTAFVEENCGGGDEDGTDEDGTDEEAPAGDEESSDEGGDEAAAGGDLETWCGLMAQPDFSIDGVDELMAATPPAIAADVLLVVQAQAAEDAGVESEDSAELDAARASVEDFIGENC